MRRALRVLVVFAAIFATAFDGAETAKAQDAADPVRAADQRYLAALRGNDRKTMGIALAAKFYATDPAGRTYVKAEVMRNLSVLGP